MNIALLTAGGVGNRMGQDIPKQFMTIDNIPVIIYTMQAFQSHPQIDAICVVCLKGWEVVLQAYANQFNITKLKWIFEGGDSNQHSIRNGLWGLRDAGCAEDDIILVHDGGSQQFAAELEHPADRFEIEPQTRAPRRIMPEQRRIHDAVNDGLGGQSPIRHAAKRHNHSYHTRKERGDDARLRPLLHHHVLEEISRLSRTEAGE